MSCKIDVSNSVAQGKRGPISLAAQDAAEDEDASAVDPADTWTPERASEITKHRAVITTDLPEACPMETNLLGLAADLLVASYLEHSEVPGAATSLWSTEAWSSAEPCFWTSTVCKRKDGDAQMPQVWSTRTSGERLLCQAWQTSLPELHRRVCARDAVRTKERTPGMGS